MYSPTLEEFQQLAARGNLIPVTRKLLADFETPLSAYRKMRGQGESFLFESVEGGEHLGRYPFVGCNPLAVIRQNGARIEVLENGKVVDKFTIPREPHPDCDVGFIDYEFIHDVEPVVPRLLEANSEMAVAELNGKTYVLGGYPASRVTQRTVQVYDVVENRWSLTTPLPLGLSHRAVV
jgi:anthranilate/para-aminobenzoate synthase component I